MDWPNVWWGMRWQQNLDFPLYLHIPPRSSLLECPFYSWRWRTAQILVVTRSLPTVSVRVCACIPYSFRLERLKDESPLVHSAFGSLAHRTEHPIPFIKLGLDTPCWWFALPCPSKAVATLSTLVSNFLCFSIRNMQKKILSVKLWRSC